MKSIKTFIILIAFIVGSVFTLSAQSRTVSGKVFDEQKEPLDELLKLFERKTVEEFKSFY